MRRIHLVRVVVAAAVVIGILSTYLVWIWAGGIGGVKGWNLGLLRVGYSWLTEAGIQDGHATMAICISVLPWIVFGDRSARLPIACRVYVALAGLGLAAFVALEVSRVMELRSHANRWAKESDVGDGMFVLGIAALTMIGAALFPSPPKPYVEPEYRL